MVSRRHHPCDHCRKVDFFDKKIVENAPPSCMIRRLEKNESLFEEGAKPEDVYFVKFGSLRFFKTWEDGSRQIVRIVFSGELIGYPALLSGDSYSVTAEAREDSTVCVWEGRNFLDEVVHKPDLAKRMLAFLSRDLRQARNALLNRSVLSVEKRLAQLVIDLCMNHGKSYSNKVKWASVPRNEAAEVTSAKPETVSRILHAWKRDGLVELQGKQVLIKNIDGLVNRLMGSSKGAKKTSKNKADLVWSVLAK